MVAYMLQQSPTSSEEIHTKSSTKRKLSQWIRLH